MTIHAAKGLEFPVVILPYLSRKFRFDQEPFVDDAIGIGFSPANPEKNYESSHPSIATVMKTRHAQKTIAEEKRLFYVATTRARDRLILSGLINLNNEAPRNCWFQWLFDALNLKKAPNESQIEFPVTIEALTEDSRTPISFDLPIRIFHSIEEMNLPSETPILSLPPVDFPKVHIKPVDGTPAGEHLSVPQLQSYVHCPTNFYLKHRLGLPDTNGLVPEEDDSDSHNFDGTPRDRAVRKVLGQLRTGADCTRDLSKLINTAVKSVSDELAEHDVALHVKHFLDSDVGKLALVASESHCEQEIHALLGDHVIHGVVDRLFKDSDGLWQIVDYETDQFNPSEIQTWIDFYRPQVELYAMLVHRLYPEQQVIPATIFFTSIAEAYPIHLTADELENLEQQWIENIAVIQTGQFEKNRAHCPFCPYFVDEQCLLSDPE
jgi:ATP-dependent helicase/nuclease subunit A